MICPLRNKKQYIYVKNLILEFMWIDAKYKIQNTFKLAQWLNTFNAKSAILEYSVPVQNLVTG